MKVVILAGGLGTRISEETGDKPKPMVTIGEYPIIWHIMKIYSYYGFNEFIICCGYKKNVIKSFFENFANNENQHKIWDDIDLEVNIDIDKWKVRLVDTGLNTMTGGRLKNIKKYIKNDDYFFLTYGDGVANINIMDQLIYHKKHKKLATIAAVHPPSRFGALEIANNNIVSSFKEKVEGENSWINGGFFILSPKTIESIMYDDTVWESEPLEELANSNELIAYKHNGFWQPMDTLREKKNLEKLWNNNSAPWKIWK